MNPEPLEIAIHGLVDAMTLLFTQARLGEDLPLMQRTVQAVRHRIAQLFQEYIAACELPEIQVIEKRLTERLGQMRSLCTDGGDTTLRDHVEYCLREILVCFELAKQICSQHSGTRTRQLLLADLPILRPFDYPGITTQSTAPNPPPP